MIGERVNKWLNILSVRLGRWLNNKQKNFSPVTTQILIWVSLLVLLFYFILQIFIP